MARGNGEKPKKAVKEPKKKEVKFILFPGKTVGGYSPAKAAARAAKRGGR